MTLQRINKGLVGHLIFAGLAGAGQNGCLAHMLGQFLDQARFTDARFSGNEHQLPVPLLGFGPQIGEALQRFFASYQRQANKGSQVIVGYRGNDDF